MLGLVSEQTFAKFLISFTELERYGCLNALLG